MNREQKYLLVFSLSLLSLQRWPKLSISVWQCRQLKLWEKPMFLGNSLGKTGPVSVSFLSKEQIYLLSSMIKIMSPLEQIIGRLIACYKWLGFFRCDTNQSGCNTGLGSSISPPWQARGKVNCCKYDTHAARYVLSNSPLLCLLPTSIKQVILLAYKESKISDPLQFLR